LLHLSGDARDFDPVADRELVGLDVGELDREAADSGLNWTT